MQNKVWSTLQHYESREGKLASAAASSRNFRKLFDDAAGD
jgi:hypothetical protein